MNSSASTPIRPIGPIGPIGPISPILRIAALLSRMRAAFPECALSLAALWRWTREHLGLHRRWTAEARAIDDDLEREFPLFVELFANDPPRKRRRALAILRKIHARTETLANQLAVSEPNPTSGGI